MTRQTWVEPDADGGPPTSFERTVTTTTWSTTTEEIVHDGDGFEFELSEPGEKTVTTTMHIPAADTPPLPDQTPTAHLPGVPLVEPSRRSWLDRLRGR